MDILENAKRSDGSVGTVIRLSPYEIESAKNEALVRGELDGQRVSRITTPLAGWTRSNFGGKTLPRGSSLE